FLTTIFSSFPPTSSANKNPPDHRPGGLPFSVRCFLVRYSQSTPSNRPSLWLVVRRIRPLPPRGETGLSHPKPLSTVIKILSGENIPDMTHTSIVTSAQILCQIVPHREQIDQPPSGGGSMDGNTGPACSRDWDR